METSTDEKQASRAAEAAQAKAEQSQSTARTELGTRMRGTVGKTTESL
jgi:hypothetical protein